MHAASIFKGEMVALSMERGLGKPYRSIRREGAVGVGSHV